MPDDNFARDVSQFYEWYRSKDLMLQPRQRRSHAGKWYGRIRTYYGKNRAVTYLYPKVKRTWV